MNLKELHKSLAIAQRECEESKLKMQMYEREGRDKSALVYSIRFQALKMFIAQQKSKIKQHHNMKYKQEHNGETN